MTNVNFSQDFENIFNGLRTLENHLESELKTINNRINYLEEKQHKDDDFFITLETLLRQRNNS